MTCLLSANLMRLRRSRTLWLFCGFFVLLPAVNVLLQYRESIVFGVYQPVEQVIFFFAAFLGFPAAAFCSLFLGTGTAEGGIRMQAAAGHSRAQIYLAGFLSCMAAVMLFTTVSLAVGFGLGLPLLGATKVSFPVVLSWIAGLYALSAVYAAVFTLLSVLTDRRAALAACAILLSAVLLVVGAYIAGRLEALPTIAGYTMSINGVLQPAEAVPNPAYVPEGPMRTLLQTIHNLLPGDQSFQFASCSVGQPMALIAWDAVLLMVLIGAGLLIFQRRNLK